MGTQAYRLYPAAKADAQPTAWWYYGRAIYVSRHDYWKIFKVFAGVGIPLAIAGIGLHLIWLWDAAVALAVLGFAMLFYSLFGLYRQYGHPAPRYFRKLLQNGGVSGAVTVADIHIGTYRHSYNLAALLPEAKIYSVDCWQDGFSSEIAISDVRALEPAPRHEARIVPLNAPKYLIPLEAASCDVVVFGFGTHEIPPGAERQKIFAEAMRILRPGGRTLLFEHGIDPENFLIFGPVIKHVTKHVEWMDVMRTLLQEVKEDRMYAVDMISGVKP